MRIDPLRRVDAVLRPSPWMASELKRPLVVWSLVLLALLALHDLTHIVDDGLDTTVGQLALVATPQWIVLAVVTAVVIRGDAERSAIAAFLLGAGTAIGFAIVHLLPFALADYWGLEPSFASWLLAWVPTAVGVFLAVKAWQVWRGPARVVKVRPA